ncbi:MAG: hypothetical protein AAF492_29180, partial [Verrucomicrobiota bacterium]
MKQNRWPVYILSAALLQTGFAVEGPPFITGFETGGVPPYVTNNLSGQGTAASWSVPAGTANVQTSVVARGNQAVELGSNSVAEVATSVSNNVVWTDLHVWTTGSTQAPTIPSGPASVVLFFASNTLWALDGSGTGTGFFVNAYSGLPSNRFVRVSVRKDFLTQTYDVWIDGNPQTNGLGFKDNDRTSVQAVEFVAETNSYLDDLSVTFEGLDTDADADNLADLDEIKFNATDPLNPDTDGDRMLDGDEVCAATIPTDSNSWLQVWLDSIGPSQFNVRVQTELGLSYTVQSNTNVLFDTWLDVAGATNVPGTGGQQSFPVDASVPTR